MEVIDKFNTNKETLVRVSRPTEDPDHYVVATYTGTAYHPKRRLSPVPGIDNSVLQRAEHFKGPTAEDDAMSYYLSLIDPEEFGGRELNQTSYPSWVAERSYKL